MLFRKKNNEEDEQKLLSEIDKNNLPKHIGIIMDGNGRWAKKRNLPRNYGHRAGVESLKKIVRASSDIGIKYLTVYGFSTENWRRPDDEVNALMSLLVEYLTKELDELNRENVVINYMGDIEKLPDNCQEILKKSHEKTIPNNGLVLNLAFNYGSRSEITGAVMQIAKDVKEGKLEVEDINEEVISGYMYTKDMPDPDLIIRPSGEYRLSNFLLWQAAYSELWFSNIYWPDFSKESLYGAILDYQNRERRFGAV